MKPTTASMGKSNASLDKGKAKAEDQDQSFNASKTAKSNDTKVKKPEKIKLRRIHVSGLPDITEQEAKDRFKSFGEVLEVDGLGKLDATGECRFHFRYVDVGNGLD